MFKLRLLSEDLEVIGLCCPRFEVAVESKRNRGGPGLDFRKRPCSEDLEGQSKPTGQQATTTTN